MKRPEAKEFNPYYAQYIDRVETTSVLDHLKQTCEKNSELLRGISNEKHHYAYAEGKWTVLDVIQHIVDTELVFTYRALSIARGTSTPLPGFDQDLFADTVDTKQKGFEQILQEYQTTRKLMLLLFQSFTETELTQIGNASGSDLSVRAAAYIIAGHEQHHFNVLVERYSL